MFVLQNYTVAWSLCHHDALLGIVGKYAKIGRKGVAL